MKTRVGLLSIIVIVGWFYFSDLAHNPAPPQKPKDNEIESPENNALYQALQHVNFIQQGQSNAMHSFYAIIDPNCSFCHALFEASQAAIENGKLAVRWVVIGVVKQSSPLKAIAILNAKDPVKALEYNERHFNYGTEEGGIQPLPTLTDVKMNKLNQNILALKDFINAVPVIIYKNQQGGVRISGGEKLPLAASKTALEENRIRVKEFLIHSAGTAF